jgi:cohesin complex subunit SCC1
MQPFSLHRASYYVILYGELQVLKSYGLIDLQQEEPYGDIALKLTSTLSKAQL